MARAEHRTCPAGYPVAAVNCLASNSKRPWHLQPGPFDLVYPETDLWLDPGAVVVEDKDAEHVTPQHQASIVGLPGSL